MEGVKDLHGKQLQQPSQRKQQQHRQRQGQGSVGKSAGHLQGEQQLVQKGRGRQQQQQKGKQNEQQQQPLAQMGPAGLRLCSAASTSAPLPLPADNPQHDGGQEQVMPHTGFYLLATETHQQQQEPQEPQEQPLLRAPQDQQGAGDLHHSLQREQQQGQQHILEVELLQGLEQQQRLATAQTDHGLQQHHLQQQQQEAWVPQTVIQNCYPGLPSLQQQEGEVGEGEQWGQGMLQQVYQQQKQWQQQPQRRKPQLWSEQLKQWQEFQEAQQSKEEQRANQPMQQQQQQGGLAVVTQQSYQSLLHGTEGHLQRQTSSEPQLQRQQASIPVQDGPWCAHAVDLLPEVYVQAQLLPHSQPMAAASGPIAVDVDHITLPPSSPGLQLGVLDPELDGGLGFDELLVDVFHPGSSYQEQQGGLGEQGGSMQQQQQQREGQVAAHPLHACYAQNQGQQTQQQQLQAGWCQELPVSQQQQHEQQQHGLGLQFQQQELGASLLLPTPPLMLPELGAPSYHTTPEQLQPQVQP